MTSPEGSSSLGAKRISCREMIARGWVIIEVKGIFYKCRAVKVCKQTSIESRRSRFKLRPCPSVKCRTFSCVLLYYALLRHTNGESSLVRCERRRVLKLQMASVGAPTLSASDHAYDHACYVLGLVRVNWRS